MNLLLDTHIFLWLNDAPEQLSASARSSCENPLNRLHLSLASVWEIQIKLQLGKLRLESSWRSMIETQRETNGLLILPITLPHIEALGNLPPVHRDPFDRMIMAQAIHENMTIVTHDPAFSSYPVQVVS